MSVEQAENDRHLVSEFAQAGRHRVAKLSQVPPTEIISLTLETEYGSAYFMAVIIGGGPGE